MKGKLNKVMIGTDNQAVLLGMQNQKSKPGHHLMDRIHNAMENFQVTQVRIRDEEVKGYRKGVGRMCLKDGSNWKEWKLKMRYEIKFVWTPGHEDIEGNMRADEAVKEAAMGQSSHPKNLPIFLR